MNKFLLSFAFLLSLSTAHSQKIQFSDTTNLWSWVDSTIGCCVFQPVRYTFAHYDTVTISHDGHTYRPLITSLGTLPVRAQAGKIYAVDPLDSQERVMYDFTLGLNDTLKLTYPNIKYTSWVTLIDSTQIAGLWYKVWHFEGLDSLLAFTDSVNPVSYNVIEGIGCTNGVTYPVSPYYRSAFYEHLLCFKNSTYSSPALSNPVACFSFGFTGEYFDDDSSCSRFDTSHHSILVYNGVNQLLRDHMEVSAVPNPMTASGELIFSTLIGSGNVSLYNDVGERVANFTFLKAQQILIGDRINVPGIYYYHVTDNKTGAIFTGKFVRW